MYKRGKGSLNRAAPTTLWWMRCSAPDLPVCSGLHVQVIEHLALSRLARDRAFGARPCVVSIDIPSGLNAIWLCRLVLQSRPILTVTFTAPKPANVLLRLVITVADCWWQTSVAFGAAGSAIPNCF
jgi:hypothetical protein